MSASFRESVFKFGTLLLIQLKHSSDRFRKRIKDLLLNFLRSEDGHGGSPPPHKVVLHIILVSHRHLLTFFFYVSLCYLVYCKVFIVD